MESLTSEERGSRAEVSVVKLDVVGPLLPSPQAPRRPPAAVVPHGSPVVVLPDLHTQHAAFRANCEKEKLLSPSGKHFIRYSMICIR